MSANKFVLKHKHIEVEYTVGITPGLTALSYHDGSTAKKFTSNEVTVEKTGVGQLISVVLIHSIDAGGERFGFLLPEKLDVPREETKTFHTVGVYWTFGGRDSVNVMPSWRCVELQGTAQSVIVPLVEAGAR